MISVICGTCGHRNPPGANFCSSCGTALSGVSSDTTVTFHPVDVTGPGFEEDVGLPLPERPRGVGLLVIRRGPNAGSRFLLTNEITRAGRHPESDIFLDDITVSRRHVEFVREGGGYTVRDVGSLNGTYVNRERIDEARLTSGDEVQIGKFKLVYLAASDEEPADEGERGE